MGIRVEGLRVVFDDATGAPLPLLDIPELELAAGDELCLVGPSGSGKTTLLNSLVGIIQPTAGRVFLGAVDLLALPEAARDVFRAEHVGYVFQTMNLLQGLSALENVALAATLAGTRRRAARSRARALLERLDLGHRLHARPATLSMGEQRRVSIARAVVNRPQVVLADEPTANLDPRRADAVVTLLKEVVAEAESLLLLVTHEHTVEDRFADVRTLAELSAA